jgi:hypothetical protein
LEKGVTGKKNRGRQGAFWYYCRAAGGEEIRAPEEKELRRSGTWSFFFFYSRRWQGWETAVNCSSRCQRWPDSGGCRAENRAAPRGGREREISEDLFVILENYRDLLVKKNLTTILGLKQRCDQNESCTTFQVLQLCFRVWTPKLNYEVLF